MGSVAIGHLRRGSTAAARAAADETMKWIRQLGTFSFYLMTGHSAPVEVYLELWESARREALSDIDGLRQSALEALARCGPGQRASRSGSRGRFSSQVESTG